MSVPPVETGNLSVVTPLVLVALDASARGELALDTGARLATKLDADVVAVHVGCDVGERELARAAGVPLFVRAGDVAAELGDAYLELRACAIVASGAVAREVLSRVPIAVAVAPNEDGDVEIDLVDQPVSTQARNRAERSG